MSDYTDAQIDRVAEVIAYAADADYWVDEIAFWEGEGARYRHAHPEEYPGSAYEYREQFRTQARAALAAAGVTQPEPEYEYTSANYDGTPNNQSFYVYGSVPARIAKYRRVKAGDWEPVPNQTGETP